MIWHKERATITTGETNLKNYYKKSSSEVELSYFFLLLAAPKVASWLSTGGHREQCHCWRCVLDDFPQWRHAGRSVWSLEWRCQGSREVTQGVRPRWCSRCPGTPTWSPATSDGGRWWPCSPGMLIARIFIHILFCLTGFLSLIPESGRRGRRVYHIDFGDGINAGNIKAHSNLDRTLYHRWRRAINCLFH